MITLDQGVDLVWHALKICMVGRFTLKKFHLSVVNKLSAFVLKNRMIIGIRPGEKIHEQMIGIDDAPYTYEYDNYYKILPNLYN